MSRGGLDDVRGERADRTQEAPEPPRADPRTVELPTRGLDLPRGERRERVESRTRDYQLRGSETRILATIGAFRVVPADDLTDRRGTPEALKEDLRSLDRQGLIERRTVPINREATRVVVLTKAGKSLLDAHQPARESGERQQYHAGLVKPRELAHDAQLYRLYQAEASRIEADGGRVDRVVLDYELKRDYQRFLNRPNVEGEDREDDLQVFASDYGLPIIDGHLELPDLRIEYETADGRMDARDLELVTEHYSRGQLSGKARAGFGMYRAAGGGTKTGGTPFDPHHLVRLS